MENLKYQKTTPEKQILDKINERSVFKFKNLLEYDEDGRNALFFALYNNNTIFLAGDNEKKLVFEKNEFDYLIKNSDLKQEKQERKWAGMNALMMYFFYGYKNKIILYPESINYLLENSDLNQRDYNHHNALDYLIILNRSHPKIINEAQFAYLVEHSDDRKIFFYKERWVCPIVIAANNKNHENNDFMVIKMIEKRLKTEPEYFNEKYFNEIKEEAVANKIRGLLDVLTTKGKISKEIGKADNNTQNTKRAINKNGKI